MQYHSALILLYRPTAGFGKSTAHSEKKSKSNGTAHSRSICVRSAIEMSELLQAYEQQHGSGSTLSGVALHPISTAATVLLAEIADSRRSKKGEGDVSIPKYLQYLQRCVKTLSELEKSYLVAKRVRKILQVLLRLCTRDWCEIQQLQEQPEQQPERDKFRDLSSNFSHPTKLGNRPITTFNLSSSAYQSRLAPRPQSQQHVQLEYSSSQFHSPQSPSDASSSSVPSPILSTTSSILTPATHHTHPAYDLNFLTTIAADKSMSVSSFPVWDPSWNVETFLAGDENAPMTSQMDILHSWESFFGNGFVPS